MDGDIDHPEYYTRGRIEPIDVIEDWQLGWHLGNPRIYGYYPASSYRKNGNFLREIWWGSHGKIRPTGKNRWWSVLPYSGVRRYQRGHDKEGEWYLNIDCLWHMCSKKFFVPIDRTPTAVLGKALGAARISTEGLTGTEARAKMRACRET
ncbi:MAG: hypothetical protein GTO63_34260 [Anaerolineae bacterium]|nr:hypothetical protein [Anaerolineae bacterium]NIN99704.1 hypothetical protein [Anaerolineae bacterium]NIQ82556.1 hypothetical protein [Anaerolineae bacterium]